MEWLDDLDGSGAALEGGEEVPEHALVFEVVDASPVRPVLSKVFNRLLRPLLAADQPPAQLQVRQALKVLDRAVTDYIDGARMTA